MAKSSAAPRKHYLETKNGRGLVRLAKNALWHLSRAEKGRADVRHDQLALMLESALKACIADREAVTFPREKRSWKRALRACRFKGFINAKR